MKSFLLFYCMCIIHIRCIENAKIFGLFISASKSHTFLGRKLFQALALKGHNVTMATPYPELSSIENYREYKILDGVETLMLDRIFYEKPGGTRIDSATDNNLVHIYRLQQLNNILTERTLSDPTMKLLLQEKFDLVIMELFGNDAHLALGHHFGAPTIVFSSIGATQITNDLVGNPEAHAHIPQPIFPFSDQMTFSQRCINTLASTAAGLYKYFIYLPIHQAIIDQYFPNSPSIYDLMANVSLVFVNSHPSISFPRAFVPNMIEIGGFHLRNLTTDSKLTANDQLQRFLDEASEGFIYFSIGTNLKSSFMSNETRDVFLKVFKQLKQRVVWKWEIKDFPGLPENIMTSKWFPQQDIIAHRNCKAFISHVGISSLMEAVYYGVPLIAMPLFGDQPQNGKIVETFEIGVQLEFGTINEKSLRWAIDEVINNTKYRENIKKRSELFRDYQIHPLDKAVYWVEYVLRHKGAPHLQSGAVRLNRFQCLSLDVLLFFITVIFIIFSVIKFICKTITNSRLVCFKTKVD